MPDMMVYLHEESFITVAQTCIKSAQRVFLQAAQALHLKYWTILTKISHNG